MKEKAQEKLHCMDNTVYGTKVALRLAQSPLRTLSAQPLSARPLSTRRLVHSPTRPHSPTPHWPTPPLGHSATPHSPTPHPATRPLARSLHRPTMKKHAALPRRRLPARGFSFQRARVTGAADRAPICRGPADARDSRLLSRRPFSQGTHSGVRPSWISGRKSRRLWLRGHVERRVRSGDAGARAWRFRPPQFRFGAGRAGHVSDSHLRIRRAETAMAASIAIGPGGRLFRADRAGIRLKSSRYANHSAERG